ncbi:hypothetical protein [Spirochaeta africana]|uniref:Uncharacterized protein n=1 Tax=Spirochaeta africana (strain ATCC 700263 / DSM 8902 / Z-7692) TaxID=889378 RepID=H9UJC9_SPIAZ|nr:hypothetical protein [Spirochaeta africana]AFG37622.1 hypothetical protein Spiaf_1563 [Spirochaeta africana DSM 8902]
MTFAQRIQNEIIYQTDPRLPWEVNRYGCRVMSLIAIPQFVTGKALTIEQVTALLERGRREPDVIVNDLMRAGSGEHWLIDQAFQLLGSDRRGRQVGWNPEHVQTVPWEYMIAHWQTDGADGHFTLHDRREVEIYDPHNPEQAGSEINKHRIIRRLLYSIWGTA